MLWQMRFWSKVDIRGPNECWPWKAGCFKMGGYGAFYKDGKMERAHVIAFEMKYGKIEKDIVIRHSCDNPPCCNDLHLISGTRAQNNQDMVERRRNQRGDLHWTRRMPERVPRGDTHVWHRRPELIPHGFEQTGTKLSEDDIREIRWLRAQGWLHRSIAELKCISRSHVTSILLGKRRGDVT